MARSVSPRLTFINSYTNSQCNKGSLLHKGCSCKFCNLVVRSVAAQTHAVSGQRVMACFLCAVLKEQGMKQEYLQCFEGFEERHDSDRKTGEAVSRYAPAHARGHHVCFHASIDRDACINMCLSPASSMAPAKRQCIASNKKIMQVLLVTTACAWASY
jgi:hypothetical protein